MDILKRDSTWEFMNKFIRAVFPMLIVLRMADQKDPVMDKLYFYVRRMDKTLEKSKTILDDYESKIQGISWRIIKDLDETNAAHNNSDSEASNFTNESSTEEEEEDPSGKTLGDKIIDLWNKQQTT